MCAPPLPFKKQRILSSILTLGRLARVTHTALVDSALRSTMLPGRPDLLGARVLGELLGTAGETGKGGGDRLKLP